MPYYNTFPMKQIIGNSEHIVHVPWNHYAPLEQVSDIHPGQTPMRCTGMSQLIHQEALSRDEKLGQEE